MELQRLAEDEQYRMQQLGSSKLDWPAIGQALGVGGGAARAKLTTVCNKKAAGTSLITPVFNLQCKVAGQLLSRQPLRNTIP